MAAAVGWNSSRGPGLSPRISASVPFGAYSHEFDDKANTSLMSNGLDEREPMSMMSNELDEREPMSMMSNGLDDRQSMSMASNSISDMVPGYSFSPALGSARITNMEATGSTQIRNMSPTRSAQQSNGTYPTSSARMTNASDEGRTSDSDDSYPPEIHIDYGHNSKYSDVGDGRHQSNRTVVSGARLPRPSNHLNHERQARSSNTLVQDRQTRGSNALHTDGSQSLRGTPTLYYDPHGGQWPSGEVDFIQILQITFSGAWNGSNHKYWGDLLGIMPPGDGIRIRFQSLSTRELYENPGVGYMRVIGITAVCRFASQMSPGMLQYASMGQRANGDPVGRIEVQPTQIAFHLLECTAKLAAAVVSEGQSFKQSGLTAVVMIFEELARFFRSHRFDWDEQKGLVVQY